MGAWIALIALVSLGWANGKAVVPVQPLAAGAPFTFLTQVGSPTDSRDAALAQLAAAGLPQLLKSEGLVLWKFSTWRPRSGGVRAGLTLGLPHDRRPIDRRQEDPERREELRRLVDGARARVTELAGAALGIASEDVTTDERLIETCCGVGCGSCLLVKPQHAPLWAGSGSRPGSR